MAHYIVHYVELLRSAVVHYIGNRASFGTETEKPFLELNRFT